MTTQNIMRKLPIILAIVFMLVQVSGLSSYATMHLGSDVMLGRLFALALEAAVFGCSYWMRQSITRKDGTRDKRDYLTQTGALVGALVFVVVSGALNTAKTLTDLPADHTEIDYNSALIFGIFPPVAAALLGIMQGLIDRLPAPPPSAAHTGRMMRVYALVDTWLTLMETRIAPRAEAHDAVNAKSDVGECELCGASSDNPGSHARWHCKKNPKSRDYGK